VLKDGCGRLVIPANACDESHDRYRRDDHHVGRARPAKISIQTATCSPEWGSRVSGEGVTGAAVQARLKQVDNPGHRDRFEHADVIDRSNKAFRITLNHTQLSCKNQPTLIDPDLNSSFLPVLQTIQTMAKADSGPVKL
jgi:hypothetical protein